jgi:phospholipid/cholesterol/gamma-HCH transport system substrate-binding protein
MSGNVVETLIGAVVLVVAAVFLVFAYSSAGVHALGGYELIAKFDRVDGLTVGGDVRMSGIKVGAVTAATLDPKTFQAVVHFSLQPDIKLPDDSSAKIASQGLLGGNYISIEPGGSEKYLKAGDEVHYVQGAVNLMDLISQAIFSVTGGGGDKAKPALETPKQQ